MLKSAPKILQYFARQSKQKKPNLQQIQQKRSQMLSTLQSIYSSSDRKHTDRVYQQVVYGRKCHIAGITSDSYQSSSYIQSICYSVNPDLVILGNYNSSRLVSEEMVKGRKDRMKLIRYDTALEPQKLFCKSIVAEVLTKIMEENQYFCKTKDNQVVLKIDQKNRHIHSLNYFTICNRLLNHSFSKLMFGLPSDYIIFQDLIINRSIAQLREIFQRVIQAVKNNRNQLGQQSISYRYFPQLIAQQLRHHSLFEPLLTQKQLTYTTSLLNHVVKSCQRVLLFVPNNHVHQIAQNVHKVTINPKQVYRQGYSHQNIKQYIESTANSETGIKLNRYIGCQMQQMQEMRQEIMEKFVILNYLKNWTLEKELLEGVRVFEKMVVKKLFQDVSNQQIINMYKKIKEEYVQKVGQIIEHRIKNIKYYKPDQKDYYTLPEMLKTQEQRNYDFPVQLTIDNEQTRLQIQKDTHQLLTQVERMISKQLTSHDKQLMLDFKKGHKSRQNIVLYQKLLVQAKIRLKKSDLKLPVYHYGMMAEIFKDQMKYSMLTNRSKRGEKLMDTIQELKKQGVMKQVTDQNQIQKLFQSGAPRISINLDQTGNFQFNNDVRSFDNLQNALKNDKMLKQAFQMSQIATQDDKMYEMDAEQNVRKTNDESGNKQKSGRLRRVKGLSMKK